MPDRTPEVLSDDTVSMSTVPNPAPSPAPDHERDHEPGREPRPARSAVRPRWLVLAALPLVVLLVGGVLLGARFLVQNDKSDKSNAQLAAANTNLVPQPRVTSSSALPTATPSAGRENRHRGAARSLGVISGKHQFRGPGSAPKGSAVVFVLAGDGKRWKHVDTEAPYRWAIDSTKLKNGRYKLTAAVVEKHRRPVLAVRSLVVRNRATTPAPSGTTSPKPSSSTSPTKPSTGTGGGSGSTGGDLSGQAAKVLSITNSERAKAGCKALTANSKLTSAAQAHSADMAKNNYFSHDSQDGRSPFDRMKAAGYSYSAAGENIAYGQPDAESVMTAWMNSPGHKANILNCSYTEIGIGYALKDNTPYWTQDFGKPL